MSNSEDSSPSNPIKGIVSYTRIYSISKEVKETTDEIVKPVRSEAPPYLQNFLRFTIIGDVTIREMGGHRIAFDLKVFEDSNLFI